MPSSKQKALNAYPGAYSNALRELIQLAPEVVQKWVLVVHESRTGGITNICPKSMHDTRRRKLATFINACYAARTIMSVEAANLQQLKKYHGIELRVKSTYDPWKNESMIGLMLDYTKEERQRRLIKQLMEGQGG